MRFGDPMNSHLRSKLPILMLALAAGFSLALLGNAILASASAEPRVFQEPLPTPGIAEAEGELGPAAALQLQAQAAAPDIPPPPGPVSDQYGNVMSYGSFVPAEWVTITSSTPITFGLVGERYKAVNLGFIFPFYEFNYSKLYVYADGIIMFDGATTYQDPIPMDYPPNNYIAPFFRPLDVGYVNTGRLYTSTIGSVGSRKFIAEWYNVTPLGGITQTLTFEVILYESSGNIQFLYKDVKNKGEYASVGIEDSDGVDGLQYMFHEPDAVSAGLGVFFQRPAGAGSLARVKILPAYRGKLLDNYLTFYLLTIRNASMLRTDTFDLSCTPPTGWQVDYFEANGVTPLQDTNGNSNKDTGTLIPGASKTILVRVRAPRTEAVASYKDLKIRATSSFNSSVWEEATLRAAVPVNFATALYNEGNSQGFVDLIWKNNEYMPLLIDTFDGGNLAFARKPDKGYVYTWDNQQKPEEGNNKYKEIRFLLLNQFGTIQRGVTDIDDHKDPYENIKDERPSVAAAPNGKIGFSWLRLVGITKDVFFAVRDASGNAVGSLRSVTGNPGGESYSSASVAATTGRFVVAWVNDTAPSTREIWYAVYDSSGNPLTGKTKLAWGASVDYASPFLAGSNDGGKVLLCYTRKDAGGNETVKYNVYNEASSS